MTTKRDEIPVTVDDIVVGLDDTPTSHAGVSWALQAAHADRRRVVLVRVIDPRAFGMWITPNVLREGLADFYRPALDSAVRRARGEDAAVEVHGMLRVANPNTVLADMAEHADQIVLGLHPRSLMSRLLVGSLAHHLIRTAPCPVVLVPLTATVDPAARDVIERVVVAIGGATGTAAVAYGFATAMRRHLPLTLLHAAQDPAGVSAQYVDQAIALRDTIDAQRRAHPDVIADELSVDGDLATVLAVHAAPTDLLVIGHRKPSRVAPPIIDHVLLPLLRRPHQTIAVVADRSVITDPAREPGPLTTADDLVTGLGYH